MSEKQRADVALVERGLCESRTKAQVSIMAGEVYVGTRRIDKASELIKPEDELEIRGKSNPYASRGGLKLEKAITSFQADLRGKVCMDIGAWEFRGTLTGRSRWSFLLCPVQCCSRPWRIP